MLATLRRHWPEYLMEAAELAMFVTSVGVIVTLLEYPASPLHKALASPWTRRVADGLARGLTVIALVFSTWGKRSGAHMNPAVTLTFLRLGKVAPWDAFFYVLFQFVGGVGGIALVWLVFMAWFANPAVDFVATVPGPAGVAAALVAEATVSFVLMFAVLLSTNSRRWAPRTGLLVGALVAALFVIESPYSGTSMNPARTFGSATVGWIWTSLWVYFVGPLAGMLIAAQVYVWIWGARRVYCAKLHHANRQRCIFHCRHGEMLATASSSMHKGAA